MAKAKAVEPVNKVNQAEVWKDVVGYEGLYQVSNLGRVRSCDRISFNGRSIRGVVLKQANGHLGYKRVNLCKNGKPRLTLVHRIVAEAFLPNPRRFKEVNHKDECSTNNCVDNLEWCDHKYNLNYGTCVSRRLEKVKGKFINRRDLSKPVEQLSHEGELVGTYPSVMEASRQTGICFGSIAQCCRGEVKHVKGYSWRYIM